MIGAKIINCVNFNTYNTLSLRYTLVVIWSVFFLAFHQTAFAQDSPDKLRKALENSTDKKEKFDYSIDLVNAYMYSNNDSCDYFLDQSYLFANEVNDPKLKGTYHLTAAKVAKLRSNYNDAIDQSIKAISYFESINNIEGEIEGNTIIGHVYGLRGEYDKCFTYYNSSIQKAEEENLPLYKINALIGKGNVLYYMDSINQAEEILNEAIQLTEKFNPQDKKSAAGLYVNTGNLYLHEDNFIKAVEYYKKGFHNYYKLNDKYGMSLTSYNIGDAFLGLNEYDSSKKYFNINLFLGQELGNPEEIKYAYKGFTNMYEQQGDYQSALESRYLYEAYADSIRDLQYNAQVEALTQKFEENEKLKLAEEKLAYSEELNQKQKLINWILWVGIILVALAVVIVFILYKRSMKNRELILVKSKEIEETNTKIDKALQQKETLLKEVHHRVKNNLQLIASLLNLQSSTIDDEEAKKAIEESKSRVQAIALMHKGLYQDENYSFVDLKSYVKEIIENQKALSNTEDRTVSFNVEIDPIHLNIDQSVPIGLILSELISNSIKHGFRQTETGKIELSIKKDLNNITLTYSDNGIGLPENFNIEDQESLGFTVISALSDQIDGQLTFESYSPFKLKLTF